MKSCSDIRKEFIEFFAERGHTFVPSSPLLPAEDATLLFANAGMNQFKDIFLDREKRSYVRAANSQKCIRAGGKHNDLEDVGHDVYHHTFFEMLGNWSFGDYFKREAIQWAWELLTEVWHLEKPRLHATVFGGDPADGLEPDIEAEKLWTEVTDIDPSHIHRGSKKDNFWEMGAVGPCGPCSEIHIDLTDDLSGAQLINADDPRAIELWNLVFIQYNRDDVGKLSPLPAKHVDTGMGLERIGKVLQGKKSNYATDLWVPIIKQIETLTPHRYGAKSDLDDRFDVLSEDDIADVACRVVADHARTLTFAIADGVIPSNEGRGYVLRRILRRAARYGRQYLQIEGPFLTKLIAPIVEAMGHAFPEIVQRQEYIAETISQEETSFAKTLDHGIALFQRQAHALSASGKMELPGEVAFDLYSTYGFPVDLTQVMAWEAGMTVDMKGYEDAMAAHRELSGAGEAMKAVELIDLPTTDDSAKYSCQPIEATVLGWVIDGKFVTDGKLNTGDSAAVVLDKTNFYGEKGGQVGDTGELTFEGGHFSVEDSSIAGSCVLHIGRTGAGSISPGQKVLATVSKSRIDTMRNHTATHLLNWALREVLGNHVDQAGSVVSPDRLRFDFSHNHGLTEKQLSEAERLVNERVLADEEVTDRTVALAEAKKIPGVRALFGEKYPDPVRLISIGSASDQSGSAEFCGGTHLNRTSQIGLFKIVSEESVAKGVRRITALTGQGAIDYVQQMDRIMRSAGEALRVPPAELSDRIVAMQQEIKKLRKQPSPAEAGNAFQPSETVQTPNGEVLLGLLPESAPPAMRNLCDQLRQKGAAAAMIGSTAAGKVILVAMVTETLAKTGKIKAGDWVKASAQVVGGTGGGKPTLAQAGGKSPEKLPEALAAAAEYARGRLT